MISFGRVHLGFKLIHSYSRKISEKIRVDEEVKVWLDANVEQALDLTPDAEFLNGPATWEVRYS